MKTQNTNAQVTPAVETELDMDALENVSGGFLYSGSKLEMCATMSNKVGCVYWAMFLS